MKTVLIVFTSLILSAFNPYTDCGDGKVYANKKQTESDNRFISYPKTNGLPRYTGEAKKLDKLIRSQLKTSQAAKTKFFVLNYQFTVSCDGKLQDFKQLGDSKLDDSTNIDEIIQATEGDWTPAKNNGMPVSCIYFGQMWVNGSLY